MTEQRPPKVFISYSHDTIEHQERVLDLADRLRDGGIDAEIDQYNTAPGEGWPLWCERQIEAADVVLMVCTQTYHRRVKGGEEQGKGLGVVWEARIIRQLLYEVGAISDKFVPVLFSDASPEQIPTPIKGWTRYVVDTEDGYEELYRHLTGQPRLLRPALGTIRPLPTRSRQWSEGTILAASSSLDHFARVEHLSISNAVRIATAHIDTIKHLRIFASTTDLILPVIADHRLHIDTCEVAIQWFDRNANDAKTQTLYAQCENKIAFWQTLKEQNFIKRILIKAPFGGVEIVREWQDDGDNVIHYGDQVSIRVCDGTYWQVNRDDGDKVMALSKHIKEWEIIEIVAVGDEFVAKKNRPVRYNEKIAFLFTENKSFVGAQFDYNNNELTACVPWVKEWEIFTLLAHPKISSKDQKLRYGSWCALRAHNGKHVMFDKNDSKQLLAIGARISDWESFVFIRPFASSHS